MAGNYTAKTAKTTRGHPQYQCVCSMFYCLRWLVDDQIQASFIPLIDGAGDVHSLRRKELFWQYKLGVFSPKGLNERVADIELDLFACGSA